MATLTWRNVDSPDFGGAINGVRTAASLLSNASKNWDDHQAALGQEAADAQRLAMANETLSQQQYVNGRTRDADTRMDNAGPAYQQLVIAARNGDQSAMTKLLEGEKLGGLRPEQFAATAASGDKFASTGQSFRANQGDLDFTNYTRDRTKNTNSINDQVTAGLPDLIRGSANQSQLLANTEKLLVGKSPDVQAAIIGAVNKYAPGTYGMGAIAGTTVPGDNSSIGSKVLGTPTANTVPVDKAMNGKGENAYDTVLGFGEFAKPDKPVTQMTMSEALKFGDTLKAATKGNTKLGLPPDKGSSALGAFQITGETLRDYGPKVLGKDWESQPMNAANQDKIAQAIFEDRKNGNLKSTWTSLQDAAPGAYKNASWPEMRRVIAKGEVGGEIGDGADLTTMPTTGAQRDAAFQINAKVGDFGNTGIAAEIEKAQQSTKSLSEISDELRKGPLEGWSDKRAFKELQNIMTKANVTAPVAGAILARSLSAPNSDGNTFWAKYLPWVDSQRNIDSSLVQANIDQLGGGGVDRAVSAREDTKEFGDTLAAARDKANTARSELAATQQRIDSGQTALSSSLPALQAKRDAAVSSYNLLINEQRKNPNLNADRQAQALAKKTIADAKEKEKAAKPTSSYTPPQMTVDRLDQLLANGGD